MSRFDLFTMIHKGLRHALLELNVQAGRTDYGDSAAVKELQAAWEGARRSLGGHSRHEDDYIWPLLAKRSPGEADVLYAEHVEIHAFEAKMDDHLSRLVAEPDDAVRKVMGLEFYRSMQRFTALCLTHFDDEERKVLPRLWALCDDEELQGALASIMAVIDEEERAYEFKHMLESVDPSERARLQGMAPTAPTTV